MYVVNLFYLLLVQVVNIVGHMAHLFEDFIRALLLGKELTVGRSWEQNLLPTLEHTVPNLLCLLELPGLMKVDLCLVSVFVPLLQSDCEATSSFRADPVAPGHPRPSSVSDKPPQHPF